MFDFDLLDELSPQSANLMCSEAPGEHPSQSNDEHETRQMEHVRHDEKNEASNYENHGAVNLHEYGVKHMGHGAHSDEFTDISYATDGVVDLRVQFLMLGTGVAAELRLPKSCDSFEVKSKVEELLQIPRVEQVLTLGATVWDDDRSLGVMHGSAGDVVQLTVVRVQVSQRVALSGDCHGILRLWDLEVMTATKEWQGHNSHSVTCVALRWATRRALSGGKDHRLYLWDLERWQCICQLRGHSDEITCLAAAWDSHLVISGSKDCTLRLWTFDKPMGRRRGDCILELRGHTDHVTCVDFDADAEKAASGSADLTIRVWNLNTGEVVQKCLGHVCCVNCVAADFGSHTLLSGGLATVKLWQFNIVTPYRSHKDGFNYKNLRGHASAVTCAVIECGKGRAITGGDDSSVRVWNRKNWDKPSVLMKHSLPVTCVAADWLSALAISGAGDCLWVWDLETCQPVSSLKAHCDLDEITSVALDVT